MAGYAAPRQRLAGTPEVVTSAPVPTYDALRRNDLFQAVGVGRPYDETQAGSDSSNRGHAECAGTAAANAQFDTHIIAIPEIMPVTGSIVALGFYTRASVAQSRWLAAFSDLVISGNHFPGSRLGGFENVNASSGDIFVSSVVSIPVTIGDLIWFVTQVNNTNGACGYRDCKALRGLFGDDTAAALANQLGNYSGVYTDTPRTYNASLTTFPADGVLMPAGQINLGVPGSAPAPLTFNRPSSYYKLSF